MLKLKLKTKSLSKFDKEYLYYSLKSLYVSLEMLIKDNSIKNNKSIISYVRNKLYNFYWLILSNDILNDKEVLSDIIENVKRDIKKLEKEI